MTQNLETWSDGTYHYGRLVCPYGLDANGRPANIEYTERVPVGSMDESEVGKHLEDRLCVAAQREAVEHRRVETASKGEVTRKPKTLRMDLAGLVNTPLPQRDLGPDRDEHGRAKGEQVR